MIRDLKVVLTDEELLRKGAEMADIQRKKELKEEEKKSTAKALGVEIEAFEKKQSELAIAIRDKSEMRSVVCRVEKDFIHKENLVIRTDTGEVVERHPMTASDLQTKLPIEKESKDNPTTMEHGFTGEKADDGSIPTPAGFDDADVGQVWESKLGECFIVAKADDSVVIEYNGGTTRIFRDTWAAYEMKFVRFCDRNDRANEPSGDPIGLLGEANPDLAPGQVWAIHGFEVKIESVNKESDEILVEYDDGSKSYFKLEEWTGEARFLRTDEPKPVSDAPVSEDKPKRKRWKKVA